MDRLIAELQRLYFLPGQTGVSRRPEDGPGDTRDCAVTPERVAEALAGRADVAIDPVGPDDGVRASVLRFARSGDWEAAARLYRGVLADLELPAPAVSVSGKSGYQLWFSFAEPVPRARAAAFLEALRLKYLADLPSACLGLFPGAGDPAAGEGGIDLVPGLECATGKWSAFIDPAMGAMFVDEPGLEMEPNPEKQADLLAGVAAIRADDFEEAMARLRSPGRPASPLPESAAASDAGSAGATGPDHGGQVSRLRIGGGFNNPQSFLLAVMNDSFASAEQRIEAAKALLPYYMQS